MDPSSLFPSLTASIATLDFKTHVSRPDDGEESLKPTTTSSNRHLSPPTPPLSESSTLSSVTASSSPAKRRGSEAKERLDRLNFGFSNRLAPESPFAAANEDDAATPVRKAQGQAGGADEMEQDLGESEGEGGEDDWALVHQSRQRKSGSVPPSTAFLRNFYAQPESTGDDSSQAVHPIRPKSKSLHRTLRYPSLSRVNSSPSRQSSPSQTNISSPAPGNTIESSTSGLPANSSGNTLPSEVLSLSLSTLAHSQASSVAESSSSQPLSPASSFLSAFSSPASSMFLNRNANSSFALPKASPDDQDQPAPSSLANTPAYITGRLLGRGGSGIVREVLLASTKEPLFPRQAVKVILHNNPSSSHQFDVNPEDNLHRPTLAQIQKEIELWQTLPIHHPNILPLLDSFSTRDASFLHMHYCPGGSLFDVVRRHREKDRGRGRRLMSSSFQRDDDLEQGGGAVGLPEAEARKLFKGVADGLKALHDMGVVHGDLKAENVLIDADGRPKLADFGLATQTHPNPLDAFELPSHSLVSDTHSPKKPKHSLSSFPSLGPSFNRSRSHLHAPHPRLASSPYPFQPESSTPIPSNPPSPGPPAFPPGSLPYASPELLSPPPRHDHHHHHLPHDPRRRSPSNSSAHHYHPSHYGPAPAQDVWALGVVLYFLLTSGSLPFNDAFEPRLQMKIIRGEWEMPVNVDISKEAEEVLRGCLCVDVDERWDIGKVRSSEWAEGWSSKVRSKSRSRSRHRMGRGGDDVRMESPAGRGGGSRSRSRGGAPVSRSYDNGGPSLYLPSSSNNPSAGPPTPTNAASRSRSRGRSFSTSLNAGHAQSPLYPHHSPIGLYASLEDGGSVHHHRHRSRSRSTSKARQGSLQGEEERGRGRRAVEGLPGGGNGGGDLAMVEEEKRGRQYRM